MCDGGSSGNGEVANPKRKGWQSCKSTAFAYSASDTIAKDHPITSYHKTKNKNSLCNSAETQCGVLINSSI